jgi:hypothetical protein
LAIESLATGAVGVFLGLGVVWLMGGEAGPLVVVTCHCRREGCSGVRLVPVERLARHAG